MQKFNNKSNEVEKSKLTLLKKRTTILVIKLILFITISILMKILDISIENLVNIVCPTHGLTQDPRNHLRGVVVPLC